MKIVEQINLLLKEAKDPCKNLTWVTKKFVGRVLKSLDKGLKKDKHWNIEDAEEGNAIFVPNTGEWRKILYKGKKDFSSIFLCSDGKAGFQIRGLFVLYPDTEDEGESIQDITVMFKKGRGKFYDGAYVTPYNEL